MLAIGLTILNYALLTLYDVLALRYVGTKLPYLRVAPISFSAFAIGHNLGVPSLSGGSIRYRAYSMAGLSTVQIATVIGFVSVTFGMGASLLVGISLTNRAGIDARGARLAPPLLRAIGAVLIACAADLPVVDAHFARADPHSQLDAYDAEHRPRR